MAENSLCMIEMKLKIYQKKIMKLKRESIQTTGKSEGKVLN